ncbi:MAG: Transcriptional regulator, ArsR family [uncultured Caballeronia sp.]|nr:MAG: Transcriptional regulator, ArsR family [uncultured Caballeronia sp.]
MASILSSPAGEITADDRVVPLAADLFRLLGNPTRLRIVLACAEQKRAVGAIAELLGLSPSLASHHLRLLRAARIVRAERQGKQVFYVAADRHISAMLDELLEHIAEP